MSQNQKLILVVILLATTGLILFFTYYEPLIGNGIEPPATTTSSTIEEFVAKNDLFGVQQNNGVISIVSGAEKVRVIDTKNIFEDGLIFLESLGARGVVLSGNRKTIYFALAKTGFDEKKGYFAQSKIYKVDLKNEPQPAPFASSPENHIYYWEPVEWTGGDTLLVGTYDVELGGGSEGILEFDRGGNLIKNNISF